MSEKIDKPTVPGTAANQSARPAGPAPSDKPAKTAPPPPNTDAPAPHEHWRPQADANSSTGFDDETGADLDNLFDDPEAEHESLEHDSIEHESAEQEGAAPSVAELSAQIDDLTQRLLTANADIQNLHKRFERERTDTAKYAITKFARDTVAVADNFERAITSVPADAVAGNEVLKALLDGVTMTEREFLNVLERHGVVRISPEGEIFDPHKHQAVMEQNDPSRVAGTIIQVYQPGYMIDERVLRPAMVVIAKGGPKPPRPEPDSAQADPASPRAENFQPPEDGETID